MESLIDHYPNPDWVCICECGQKIHWGLDENDEWVLYGVINMVYWDEEPMYICATCRKEIDPEYMELIFDAA